MRRIKLLRLALLSVVALAVVTAAAASAEIRPLSGEEAPFIVKGTGGAVTLSTFGLLKTAITSTATKVEVELGIGGGTQASLGKVAATFEGVKLGKISCSSENIKGEKAPKEIVVLNKEVTDVHTVGLLNGTTLVAGLLIGLLELVENEKKLDLTLNCGGVKVLILGATFLEVQKASSTADITEIGLASTALKCDSSDELCKTVLAKWDATALFFNEATKKDELRLCPEGLGAFVKEAEECASFALATPIPATINKMVLIVF
jgi:hypothetical protein